MVISIIAVLITLVCVAANGALESARAKKTAAIVAVVQQAVDTYHAQKGEWPLAGLTTRSRHAKPSDEESDDDGVSDYLSASEVRQVMLKLVQECKDGNPIMDLSGLFVSRDPGDHIGGKKPGMDFMDAIHGTRTSRKKMKLSEMYFGFPESSHGLFCRLRMKYSQEADRLLVHSN